MKSMRHVSIVLGLCAALFLIPQKGLASQSTEHLLKLIGFDAFVEGLALSFQDSDNALAQSDEGFGVAWDLAARQVFPADDMLEEIVGQMDGALPAENIDEMIQFFESDLGRKVTELEVAAQTGEGAARLQSEGSAILTDMIENDPARLQQYAAMVDALGIVEAQVTTAMNINFAIMTGMSASGKLPYEMSEEEILGNIAAQQDMFRADIQDNVFITFAYTYQDLSDAELAAYIDFLTSQNGRALYTNINRATEDVLSVRARAFGTRLMELQGVREL